MECHSLHFRLNQNSQRERLADVTEKVRVTIVDRLGLASVEHFPHFRFRSQSEQAEIRTDPMAGNYVLMFLLQKQR